MVNKQFKLETAQHT